MGYARHVGRVGALAVALGVCAAVATTPGIAHAEPANSGSASAPTADSSSTSSPGSTSADAPSGGVADAGSDGTRPSAARTRSSSRATDSPPRSSREISSADDDIADRDNSGRPQGPTAGASGDDTLPTSDDEDASTSDDVEALDEIGVEDDASARASADAPLVQVDADVPAPVAADHHISRRPAVDSIALTVAPLDRSGGIETPRVAAINQSAESGVQQVQTSSIAAAVPSPAAPTLPAAPMWQLSEELVGVASRLVAAVVESMFTPGAETSTPLLWAVLGWVRREFQRIIFQRTDEATSQEVTVVLDGLADVSDPIVLDVTEPGAGPLTYEVPAPGASGGPAHGIVTVDPATGSITYDPDDRFAALGGVDSFVVTVSDPSDDAGWLGFLRPTRTIDITATVVGILSYSDPEELKAGIQLPADIELMNSMNNVDVIKHDGRYYMAFRTAPTHFASAQTLMHVLSSPDGEHWELEETFDMGTDLREPRFLSFDGKLFFYFTQLGTNPIAFEPQHLYVSQRNDTGWSEPQTYFEPGFVGWRAREFGGKAYMSVYYGAGLYADQAGSAIYLLTSSDGLNWERISPAPQVTDAGAEEPEFEFDEDGNIWGTIRLENSGGGYTFFAPKDHLDQWELHHTPEKYDSALMLRHGDEMYLIARRNVDGAVAKAPAFLPAELRKWLDLLRYSLTQKRTAMYHFNKETMTVDPLFDFPSHGDTAFPAIAPLNDNQYLFLNYSSPLGACDFPWILGQLLPTRLYSSTITFSSAEQT